MKTTEQRVCLTIAGLDPSGGAGVIVDIETFSALGCHSAAVVTSITFQNSTGVAGMLDQTGDTVRRQIEAVIGEHRLSAVKTGMLPTRAVVEVVASCAGEGLLPNLVVDPVIRSTSGYALADEAAIEAMAQLLFPLASVVTPNISEIETITGISIRSHEDLISASELMRSRGVENLLVKGGHSTWEPAAVDRLFEGSNEYVFSVERIATQLRGSGCMLASAIAANLASGQVLHDAVRGAKKFVTKRFADTKSTT